MKKSLYSLSVLLAAIAMLFVGSCSSDPEPEAPKPPVPDTQEPFVVEVEEVTATSATTKVVPADPEMYYIMYFCDASYLTDNGLTTDDALFEDDMYYFKRGAEQNVVTLLEYMQQNRVVYQGTMRAKWTNVQVGKRSVLYVYGIKFNADYTDCERITEVNYTYIEPERADINEEISFSVEVTTKGADATFEITPEGWDGYYSVQIFAEEHLLYYRGDEVSDDYMQLIGSAWADMYQSNINVGFTPEQVLEGLCYKGQREFLKELWTETNYCAVIFAIEEVDGSYQMVSRPVVEHFSTEAVQPSEMTLEIAVENCYVRVCDLKITPSVDDESYIMLFIPTELLPANYTDVDLVETVLGDYYDFTYTFRGSITSHMSTLTPSTEYIVVAFGYSGGVKTTPVFKHVLKTQDEGECELSIVDVEYGGPYKISEVDRLMPGMFNVVGMPDDTYYLMWAEVITSEPTPELFAYIVDTGTYNAFGEELVFFDLLFDTCDPVHTDTCEYGYGYYVCAAAFDYKGDVTPMWRSEEINWTVEDLRPAQELVDKLRSSPNARAMVLRAAR